MAELPLWDCELGCVADLEGAVDIGAESSEDAECGLLKLVGDAAAGSNDNPFAVSDAARRARAREQCEGELPSFVDKHVGRPRLRAAIESYRGAKESESELPKGRK